MTHALRRRRSCLPEDSISNLNAKPQAYVCVFSCILPAYCLSVCFDQGLYYEAVGNPARAKELYEATMQQEPHNVIIPKRLVSAAAVYKGEGGEQERGITHAREQEQSATRWHVL